MSRIPELMDDSDSALFLWWKQMATAGLAFHPDNDAEFVGNTVDGKWVPTFTKAEAREVNLIVHGIDGMHATHGDLIYEAVTLATEDPEITAARQGAIEYWEGAENIQISPYAHVETVSGGFWVEARLWWPSQD